LNKKIGIGVDIVNINRFRKKKFQKNLNFYRKILSESEIKYCTKFKSPYEHFAAKFAIKESVIKSIPDKHIKQFYNDVEWTPYPVLVIKEFQRRFKPNDEEFLEKLLESVDDAKEKGQKIGRLAKIRGLQLSKRVKARAKKTVSKKITKAKRMIRSSDDNVELLKKLGELKKAGIINNKEFQTKKKQLLDKI